MKVKKRLLKKKEDMIISFPLVEIYSELVRPNDEHLKQGIIPFTVELGLGKQVNDKYSEIFGEDWDACLEILKNDIVLSIQAFVENMSALSEGYQNE